MKYLTLETIVWDKNWQLSTVTDGQEDYIDTSFIAWAREDKSYEGGLILK